MRRIAVLGGICLLVAGCGGGSGTVDRTMQPDPPETEAGPMEPETGSMEPATTPTLEALGLQETFVVDGTDGSYTSTHFIKWGVWGGILRDDYATCTAIGCPPPGETIFMAYVNHEGDGTVSTGTQGMQSGTSPEMGSAVWTGNALAYDSEDVSFGGSIVTTYRAVTGDSRLQADFAANTVDIDFTGFDNGQADMSWDGLAMANGTFGSKTAGLEGAFYGADHEGAAGTFDRDGLTGVFGALRTAE